MPAESTTPGAPKPQAGTEGTGAGPSFQKQPQTFSRRSASPSELLPRPPSAPAGHTPALRFTLPRGPILKSAPRNTRLLRRALGTAGNELPVPRYFSHSDPTARENTRSRHPQRNRVLFLPFQAVCPSHHLLAVWRWPKL